MTTNNSGRAFNLHAVLGELNRRRPGASIQPTGLVEGYIMSPYELDEREKRAVREADSEIAKTDAPHNVLGFFNHLAAMPAEVSKDIAWQRAMDEVAPLSKGDVGRMQLTIMDIIWGHRPETPPLNIVPPDERPIGFG